MLTVDAADTVAGGLVTAGDTIVFVGSEADTRAWLGGRRARVVELAGRALLPAFIDAHGHYPGEGLRAVHVDLNAPPIGQVASIDALVAKLAERAAATSEGDWVVGFGYDDSLLAERRHPTRDDLDRASSDHPIGILHVSGHLAVANSAALAALGIGADTPDPPGGRIRRRAESREPDGVLEETATAGVDAKLRPGPRAALAMLRSANARYLAAGVATAQVGAADESLLGAMPFAAWIGLVPLRLVIWPTAEAAEPLLTENEPAYTGDAWVRRGAVKLFADGSIQGYTGYLRDPYFVPPGGDPSYRGYPRQSRDELFRQVLRFHLAGWQIAVHGNGDAAIDDILDAFEEAQRAHPRQDARHVIVHAQMARDDQLERMARLGVIPSFFALHTWYWGDRHRERFLGPERAARISPLRSADQAGLRFTLHCDSPVVPMEPLRLLRAAVERRTTSGVVLGEDQRISPARALRALTIDAARQHFDEATKGSLEVGKLADLVILSHSPLDAGAFDTLRVEETIIDGESAWRAR